MLNNKRFHEVATLKIRVYDETMTVESHEKVFAEENPEGYFPERQIYMKVSSESSDEDDQLVGSDRRIARRAKRARQPGPPAKIPTGELLTLEEASSRRVLFSRAHKDRRYGVVKPVQRTYRGLDYSQQILTDNLLNPRKSDVEKVDHAERYVNGLIRFYKPREVFVRKYRQLIKVHDGPATTREESSDSLDNLVLYDEDRDPHTDDIDDEEENQENEDTDTETSTDSSEEDEDEQNDNTDSDAEGGGGWTKRRRVATPVTEDDSTASTTTSRESCCNF